MGVLGGASGKEAAFQCRRCWRHEFDPWVGKIPWSEGMATHSSILAWRISGICTPHIHSSTIHNSQKVETTMRVFIDRGKEETKCILHKQ